MEGEFTILDGDWNDHSMWVSVERVATMRFSLQVSPDADEVEEVEFLGAS
jgi:hypothetical protein